MINLGEKLKAIRLEKGISSVQLEALSGVDQSTISRIENNLRSPTIETLLKICEALEISIIDLIGNQDLPTDFLNLINTAKKLTPQQRRKITELIESFLNS
jgi:transcriptional regulator with XRE-family HTH domain